ncbi:uncharacterized protein LOC143913566 [Arctopsyche grandis]|uniref:uncharacterized protein LOC143913566 n=1 Tax=Arctopsyche grandis TaxID=121162 RepID=UPI00406D9C24
MSTLKDDRITSRYVSSNVWVHSYRGVNPAVMMECRLCLFTTPAEALVPIHDDPHPSRLVQLIWTSCRLRVRRGDELPDMICLSCVNNLELLNSFRNACFRSDKTSKMGLDKCLKVKPEEVLLSDLIWENELGDDLPPNTSSAPDNGEIRGGKIASKDNMAEIIDIPAEELPLQKALIAILKAKIGAGPCDLKCHMNGFHMKCFYRINGFHCMLI